MIVIRAGKLIDGTGKAPFEDVCILVDGEKIRRIEPAAAVQIDPAWTMVDVRDKTVLPGLVDCHVHVHTPGGLDDNYSINALRDLQGLTALKSLSFVQKDLVMGFTSLRSLGSPAYVDVALRDAIDQGYVEGPRLKVSGQGISISGGHMDKAEWSPDVTVAGRTGVGDGPLGCRRAAREQFKRGVDLIKINVCGGSLRNLNEPWHQEMTFEEMEAVCAEAHGWGKRVAGHTSGGPAVTDAVRAGMDSVEHGSWLTREQTDLMAEKGVFYVPTLTTNTRGITMGKETIGSSDIEWNWLLKVDEDKWASFEYARKSGVKICVGTDAGFWIYHGENATELEQLVKGGLTSMEAIVAATRTGAECLDMLDQVGTVEPGKLADLVVVDGDPLKDIRILQDAERILQVYKGGKLVKG